MRVLLATILLGAMALAGCARRQVHPASTGVHFGIPAAAPAASGQKLIVTPATGLVGRVEKVNLSSRFVIVNFATGQMPELGRVMAVYRNGLKVGELKMNDLRLDGNQVADLVAGEAAKGDEVREN